jgi:hypothetical protein
MKMARLSALYTGRFNPQGTSYVLIYVRAKAIPGLSVMKPATFRTIFCAIFVSSAFGFVALV